MTAPAWTPERAQWIRDHAWPTWMRAMDDDYPQGRGCFLFRMCACQLGVCVPCSQDGRHDQCLTRQHHGRPWGWDMAVWKWTDGTLPVHGRDIADVTVVGRSCRWTCPCGCWRTDAPPQPPAKRPPSTPSRRPAPLNPGPAPTAPDGQDALFEAFA